MLTRASLLAAVLAAPLAWAAEEEPTDDDQGSRWSGEGEFGLVITSGNTETETLNARLQGAYERHAWTYRLGLRGLSASEEGHTTAERYEGTGKAEYHTSERSYWFSAARYEEDRFSGVDSQGTLTVGHGRIFIDRDTMHLGGELGFGYRRSQPAMEADMTEKPPSESDAILRGAAKYWWQITDTTRLENDFLVETGKDNTFLENQAGLRVAINSQLSLKLGYAVRRNTEVPEDREKTDTVSTVNLVYSLK